MKKILSYRSVSAQWATFFAALVAVALIVAPAAYAQSQATTATIEGVVMDESGAVVSGAEVEARRAATGWVQTKTTDSNGRYVFSAVPVGTYDVTVTMSGFQPMKYEGVILTVGARQPLDVTLHVSAVTEAVTVTGEAPLVETSRVTYQQTLNENAIHNLPIIARGFEAFVKLTPGVVSSDRNTQSFGGQKGINSNYNIDGADRNNPFFGGQSGGDRPPFVVSLEAIREFVVLNNGYNAEFGRSGAGLVNVVTRSGSNDWHGGAWYYWLEDDFITNTARTPSGAAPIEPAGRRQQYGGHIGGPISPDKAFFYFNTDNQKRTVPIALRLFTNNPADFTCADLRGPDNTAATADDITAAECTAAASALLGIEQDIAGTDDLTSYLAKVDWNVTPDNRLSGRYSYSKSKQAFGTFGFPNPFGVSELADAVESFGSENDQIHNVVISLHSAIGAKYGNEFRFNYNWEDRPRIQNPIPGANTANGVSDGTTVAISNVVLGLGAVFFLPIPETDTRTQFSDNISYIYGRHEMKFGADYNRSTVEQFFRGRARGQFDFSSFNNFANRRPDRYRQFFGSGFLATNVDELAFFAQDTWRARPNLTIDYGLRWEGQFNPGNETPNTTLPDGTTEIPDDTQMWAPRLGIAWSPSSKAVVRAWAGFFYSRTPMLLMQPPLNANGDVVGGFAFDFGSNAAVVSAFNAAGIPTNQIFPDPYEGPYNIPFDTPPGAVPASGQVNRAEIRRMADHFQNSRTFRTGPTFEYEILPNTSVSVAYVYALTTHLQRLRDINLHPACSAAARNATSSSNKPTFDALCAMGVPIYGVGSIIGDRPISLSGFPNQTPAAVILTESSGQARYQAVTFAVNKRWSHHYQFQAFYTWSEALSHDDNEREASTRVFYDPFRADLDYGRSNIDFPHNVVAHGVWELPWGFQLSGIVNWRSGAPINALTGTDSISTSPTGASALAIERIRSLVGDPNATVLRSGNGDGNSAPDRPIVNGRVLRRNAFRQDTFFQTDAQVAHVWKISERHQIKSFIDMINIFDTDNFFTTNSGVNSASFLVRNSAGTPFLFQLGIRYSF